LVAEVGVLPTSSDKEHNGSREPSPADLIVAYEQYLKSLDKCTFVVQSKTVIIGPGTGPQGVRNTESYRVWRHGKWWKQISSLCTEYEDKGKPAISKSAGESILAPAGTIRIHYDSSGAAPAGILATLGGTPPELEDFVGLQVYYPILNGLMLGNRGTLPAILRQSRITARKELLEGRVLWVVEGNGPWGFHALWIDLEKGGLPRRIVQRKQGRDKILDLTLATLPANRGGPLEAHSQQIDITGSVVVDGRHVVSQLMAVIETHKHQEEPLVEKSVFTFTQWDLNPDFSQDPFVPSVPIPDGFPVTVEGQSHIDYEWRNGRIVKKVNPASIAGLAELWFQRGELIGNSFVLLVLASVLGLGVYLWWRRRAALHR
jgi:hypothetical protein